MEAIIAKDADKAEMLANRHVINAFENIVANGLYEVFTSKKKESETEK